MRNEILDYFRKANGQFISGEQISRDLHVSRTAIWKHINILKERGYIFESSTRKGYRLIYAPNLLTPLEIDSALLAENPHALEGGGVHCIEFSHCSFLLPQIRCLSFRMPTSWAASSTFMPAPLTGGAKDL